MLMDKQIQFSNAQAITASAVSTNTLDLLTGQSLLSSGAYTSQAASNTVIGNASTFGEDIGLGRGKGTPVVLVTTGAAFLTLTSLQIQFRGAPDNSSGTIGGLSFAVYIQTDAIALALLTANTRIAVFDWPTRKIGQAMPRFVQLNYVVAGANATAGTVTADVGLGSDSANATLGQYPSNY
jgi:hypothetical protein